MRQEDGELRLIRVTTTAEGSTHLTTTAAGELSKAQLSPDGVYLVDNTAHVFVWIGREASASERRAGSS